jgi:CBS domain-containing protein
MPATVAEIMARNVQSVSADAPVREAAQQMRDADAGDVVVTDGERLLGILTDRDIAVRLVAEDKGSSTPVREICSGRDIAVIAPDASVDRAAELMRSKSVRRLPVVQDGRVVGMVCLGDLAIERDPRSALADISASEPNQ